MTDQFAVVLKRACKLVDGAWAIVVLPESREIIMMHSLSKKRKALVEEWLKDDRLWDWLFSVQGDKVRQKKFSKNHIELGERIYAVSQKHTVALLLVATSHTLSSAEKGILQLAAGSVQPEPDDLVQAIASITTGRYGVVDTLKYIQQWILRAFPAQRAYILFLDAQRELLSGYDKNLDMDYALTGTLEGTVVQVGEVIRIENVARQSKYTAAGEATVAKLVAPMFFSGEVIGVLSLESETAGAFTESDERLLGVVATYVAALHQSLVLEDENKTQDHNLQQINDIFQRVVGLKDREAIAQQVAELAAEKFDYSLVMVMLLDEDSGELVSRGLAGKEKHAVPEELRVAKSIGFPGQVFMAGESLIVENGRENNTAELISGWEAGAAVCVPLGDGKQIFGVLNVENPESNSLGSNDELILQALAGGISSMMLSAHRNMQLEQNVRQLQAVRETALDIGGDLDLETLLKRIVERLRVLLDAEGAEIAMVENETQQVRVLVSENPWRDYAGSVFPFMSGISGRVAAMGERLVIEDYNKWVGGQPDVERRGKFRSVAAVPLRVSDEIIGILSVQDSRLERVFNESDVSMLEMLASQVAILIRNARLYQELEKRIQSQEFAEARMIQSEKLAAVGELAAGIAHELNNPLTTVSGFSELVLESLPEEDTQSREDLMLVVQEARRARTVVRRLLDFSRQDEFLRTDADINEVLGSVLALIHHQATQSNVDIRVAFWDDLPKVGVDRNQMQQVFLNLVHNAIQAMPEGGEIIVRTRVMQRDDTDWVRISVQDTGTGIEQKDIDKLFEPFFTTKPAGEGTGLGLSVSYRIVADHGGFIEVESKAGEGAAFMVWLPITADIESDETEQIME